MEMVRTLFSKHFLKKFSEKIIAMLYQVKLYSKGMMWPRIG